MIIIKNDIKINVDYLINNFVVEYEIGQNDEFYNQYKKQIIKLDDNTINTILEIVKAEMGDIEIDIKYTRLNLIEENTNINDPYHTDIGYNLILTYYPNDDYEGGEFVWYEKGVVYEIKPIKNMLTIMLDNPKHKVRNVTKGKRYSIVTFCNIKHDFKKTFI